MNRLLYTKVPVAQREYAPTHTGWLTVKTQFNTAALVAALLIGILFFTSPMLSLYDFTHIEQEEVEEDTLQARNIIDAEVQQLYSTAGDYAGWDEAYAFMRDGNPKFISSSLGEAFYSKLRLNLFCMIANDGSMPVSRAYDYHGNVKLPVPSSLLHHLTPGSLLLKHDSPESGVSGFISLPEGLLMIVSRPILTSEYKGTPRGTLIIGRFLDQAETARISNLLKCRIEVLNFVSNDKNPVFRDIRSHLLKRDDVLIRITENEHITGHVQLADIYGKSAALVMLEKPRTIYRQAQQTAWRMILLYSSMCVTGAIIFMLLRKKLIIVHRSEQESKDQLHSFIELAVDGIFSISSTDSILNVNSRVCEMTGYSRTELLEMSFGQLFETSEAEELKIEELLRKKGNSGVELTLLRKDGRHSVVVLISKKMPDDTFQSIMHDISAYKAMEQELIEYHNRVNSMAIEVSIAEERERNRIAGELHDQVGPNLLLGKLKIDQLQARLPDAEYEDEFETIKEFISKSIHDIRSLTFQLRPPILANAGLEAALRWLAQDFEQHHGIQTSVLHDEVPILLEYGIRVTLFQAVRELLLNVSKHSAAHHVKITLSSDPGTLVLIVEDDGAGFSLPHDYVMHSNSFGLFNTEQRIKYHGGQMHIDSSQNRGTRIFITMPFEPEATG